MRRTWIICLVKQAPSAAYDAHSRLSVFFRLLSFLVRRHEPTAIAGADQLAAAHSANQEGASFVLAQHFLRDAMS